MTVPKHATPSAESGDGGPLRLRGEWTLAHAGEIASALRAQDGHSGEVDATGVDRLDSVGVLQLVRFAQKRNLDFSTFRFRPDHHALVEAIEDVADDRPK